MDRHWTYDSGFDPDGDLSQGDIVLRKSVPDLARGLDVDVMALLITTQSCDLVPRGPKGCKAEAISLVPIVEIDAVLAKLVRDIAGTPYDGLFRKEARDHVVDFLRRVINQNEIGKGLFYLHPDLAIQIGSPSVAILRRSFSVDRSHYPALKAGRVGTLCLEFRNKLGWMCGHLYSRIATRDWDEDGGRSTSTVRIEELLADLSGPENQYWLEQSWLQAVDAKAAAIKQLPRDEAYAAILTNKPADPFDAAVERAGEALRSVWKAELLPALLPLVADPRFLGAVVANVQARLPGSDANKIAEAFGGAALASECQAEIKSEMMKLVGQPTFDDELARSTFATLELQPAVSRRLEALGATRELLATVRPYEANAADQLVAALKNKGPVLSAALIDKVVRRLRNDTRFEALFDQPKSAFVADED